jgi:hypothetical protein
MMSARDQQMLAAAYSPVAAFVTVLIVARISRMTHIRKDL